MSEDFELPPEWRTLGPEAKKVLLHKLRGMHISKGLGGPRPWREMARPKQLPPDDPMHHLPDENGFRCGCDGPDENWNIWMFMAGRGCGKTWAGSNWIIEQALRNPGTMWAVVAPTFRDVRVTCFEGPSGIRKQLAPGEEDQWRRNELRLDLVNGSVIYGYSADQPERLRGSNLSGAWCLAEGEPVATPQGWIPIEQVRPGMQVWTRNGWRRVAAQSCTGRERSVVRVVAADGSSVRLTPDHQVWTQEHGWIQARNLQPGDTLVTWQGGKDRPSGWSGKADAGISGGTLTTTGIAKDTCCTSLSGKRNTSSVFRRVTSSITWTITPSITIRPIFSFSRAVSMSGITHWTTPGVWQLSALSSALSTDVLPGGIKSQASTSAKCAESTFTPAPRQYATALRDAARRRSAIERNRNAEMLSTIVSARDAEPGSRHQNIVPSTVLLSALTEPGMPLSAATERVPWEDCPVQAAEKNSSRATRTRNSVPWTAGMISSVVSVTDAGIADVYDLSIEGASEFVASGILVHNCDEMGSWSYEEAFYEGLVPALRIGSHPRVLVTTTPRPTRLIRDLYGRRDGTMHCTTASTWENAKNLSAAALDELRRRYEGTRLGRQELEGELLEDMEGALFQRSDIDAARIKLQDVPQLTRVVVSIDPAMTSGEESDETGIIVAGEDGRGHGYILADLSLQASPEQCMRKAVEAYNHWQADCIVAEVNNGGDFIGAVLRTVDANVPYHTVRASRGKATRAEPVSTVYEQRRIHHVGSFPQLEDQMVTFVPGIPGPSPDRLDALVWSIFELRHISQASWLSAYGAQRCVKCEFAFSDSVLACPRCGTEVEGREMRVPLEAAPDADDEPSPGSWAAVYHLKRCASGHSYADKGQGCPRCRSGALHYLRQNGHAVGPSATMGQ